MRRKLWTGPMLAIALLVGLPATAATVTANIPDGTITVLPDGRKLLTNETIRLKPPVTLKPGDELDVVASLISAAFGPYAILLTDLGKDSAESIHLTVTGKNLASLSLVLSAWVAEKGQPLSLTTLGGDLYKGDIANTATVAVDRNFIRPEGDLLSGDLSLDIRSLLLEIRNTGEGAVTIETVTIGLDADQIIMPTVPLPLSAPLLAASVGAMALLRRISTRRPSRG